MNSIQQLKDCLVIDTPQFMIEIPGVWDRKESTTPNMVYAGTTKEDNGISKQFIISGYLLVPGVSKENRRQTIVDLLSTFVETERKVTQDAAKIIQEPLYEYEQSLFVSGYIAVSPTRIALWKIFCDPEKAFSFYYEKWGFTEHPNIKVHSDEFESIMDTVALKME